MYNIDLVYTLLMKDLCIYFICPDFSTPVGGIKILYNHVDILNQNGFNACIVHSNPGFRVKWFANNTMITHLRAVRFKETDIVVIPEYMAGYMYNYRQISPWKKRIKMRFSKNRLKYYLSDIAMMPICKVIYNQNSYKTFETYSGDSSLWRFPYQEPDVLRTVVVSEDNAAYLRHVFPQHPIERVHLSFNKELFNYTSAKKKQVCFMPRKNSDDVRQVIGIMKAKGWMNTYNFVSIDGYPEEKVAEILKESLIFMSFGYPEGSPLPPCEAMICGCVVVGYHGWGGREYFKPEFCYPVEAGDIIGFVKQMEFVLETDQKHPETILEQGRKASDFISEYFHSSLEKEDVLRIWSAIQEEARHRRI